MLRRLKEDGLKDEAVAEIERLYDNNEKAAETAFRRIDKVRDQLEALPVSASAVPRSLLD